MGIERRFSDADAERLEREIVIDLLSGSAIRRRTAACACLGLHGLRISEVCNLVPEDLNPSTWQLSVRTVKGGVPRVVPIDKGWRMMLGAVFDECSGRHLISTRGGKRMKPDQVRRQLKKLYRRVLGRDPPRGFSFHALRHTFSARALNAVDERGEKPNLRTMQRALGHRSAKSTEHYLHGGVDLPPGAWPKADRETRPAEQLRMWPWSWTG